MFNNMKLAHKIISTFSLIGVLVLIMGYLNIKALKEVDESDTILYEKNTVPLGIMVDLSMSFIRYTLNVRDSILLDEPKDKKENEHKLQERRQEVDKGLGELDKIITA